LIIVNTSTCDIDRIKTICSVSKKLGRIPVATKRFTSILKALESDEHLSTPRVGVDILRYEDVYEDVKYNQEDYLLLTSAYREQEIIEVEPKSGSCFILSSSEPFGEESEIEFERLKNWLHLFGIPIYHIHSSGHVLPTDLIRLIKKLNPKTIFPIHTECPEAFAAMLKGSFDGRVIIPERGVAYTFL